MQRSRQNVIQDCYGASVNVLRNKFELIYQNYNKFEYIHPDPLEFIYNYPDSEEREIVGLIASVLAYGKVSQILVSIKKVLYRLGESPKKYILNNDLPDYYKAFTKFKHRFTSGEEISLLLKGIKELLLEYGTLEAYFLQCKKQEKNYLAVISSFVTQLRQSFPNNKTYLIPSPEDGSACKRLMLFFRWMIRRDEVDPGCWQNVSPKNLIIPLDTHMYFIAGKLNFTKRKTPDLKAALEITSAFRQINPDDPIKYDFALTRFGIRDDCI